MHKRSLENLSDVELHKKLIEYGLHSGPVTETTRPLLLKKLKAHIQSSKRTERRTTNVGTTSPYLNDSGPARPYQSIAAKELQNSNYNLPLLEEQSRSSLPSIIPARELTRRNTTATSSFDKTYAATSPRTYVNNSAINVTNTSNNKIYKRYATTNSDSEDDSMYAGNASANLMNRPALPPPPHFNVVGRLLNLRENLRDNTLQYKKSPLTAHESLEYAHKRGIYSQMKPAYAMYNNHGQIQQSLWQRIKAFARSWRGFKTSHIPHAIIFVFVVFLIVIASVYLIKNPDLASLIRDSNTHYVLCSNPQQSTAISTDSVSMANKPLFNCLEEKSFSKALAYNRELIQLLHAQAVQHSCINSSSPYYVSTHDFIRYLTGQENTNNDNHNINAWKLRELLADFQASVYLIKHNPQWNVAILNNKGVIMEPTQLKAYVADGDTRFALLKPNLPLSCVLYNKIQRFFLIMGIGVLMMSLCSVAYLVFRHIQKLKHERQTAVSNFCTEIINAVLYQASLNDGSGGNAVEKEIIVNHIRDKLIPLNKRKEYLNYWNEALKLLEANESRLQFGITLRNGEEFRCVRWVANVVSDSRDLNYRKQWQSPAFDNANKICNPPTPCLKIRYMFDNSEVQMPNLKKVIEEAIFEKVGSRCNILDIQLDLQSCCVYMRCASEDDAGIAHNEINGWWFDKRLISIKFVRLQRYLSRFPESKS